MKKLKYRKRYIAPCDANEDKKHDWKSEREDRRTFKILGKRERWLWFHGWKRCADCGVWVDWERYMKWRKLRKAYLRRKRA